MTETIYVESSKFADKSNSDNYTWRSTISSALDINEGDIITLDSCSLSLRGDLNESIEFQGVQPSKNNIKDNKIQMQIAYYISNNQQFNIPLPLGGHTINTNPAFSNYGQVDLSTYAKFRSSFPLRGIEGMYLSSSPSTYTEVSGGGCRSKPPGNFQLPSPDRIYVQDVNTYMDPPNLMYIPSVGNQKTFNFLTRNIDLELQPGFNSLSKVQSDLTAQLHKRFGDAINPDENKEVFLDDYNIEGTLGDPAAIYTATQRRAVVDQTNILYPTASSNVIRDRIETGTWSAQLEYEGLPANEGTGYIQEEGERMYYRNICSATPYEYHAAGVIMFHTKDSTDEATLSRSLPYYETIGFYTGWIPQYGYSGMVCIDNMDTGTAGVSIEYTSDTSTGLTTTLADADLLIAPKYTLITTNLIYNSNTLLNLSRIYWRQLEYNSENGDWVFDLQIGKADDEISNTGDTINLVAPNQILLGTPSTLNTYVTVAPRANNCYIRSINQNEATSIRCFSRYENVFSNMNNLVFPAGSSFQATNPQGKPFSQDMSKTYNLPVVPVYKKTSVAGNPDCLDVPFVAFVVAQNYTTADSIPAFDIGEYIGWSTAQYDNKNSMIITVQKQNALGAYSSSNNYPVGSDIVNCIPQAYNSCVYIGANDPTITFDPSLNRMSLSRLHTLMRPGNGPFDSPLTTPNSQAETESVGINFNNNNISFQARDGRIFRNPNLQSNHIICAQAGIGITGWNIFDNLDTVIPLTSDNFSGTLLDKLGFQFSDILPTLGKVNTEYSRIMIDAALTDRQKNLNQVYPLTTSAIVDASIIISLVQNAEFDQAANIGCPSNQQAFTEQTSDSIVAKRLPTKLCYPNYIILSDILPDLQYYGSLSGQQKLSAIGYINLSYVQGGYIFQDKEFQYIVKKPFQLSDITIQIRRPDGTIPDLDDKSLCVFRIDKK